MIEIDLSKYTDEELGELEKMIASELDIRQEQKKKDAIAQVKAIAEGAHLSALELVSMVKDEMKPRRAAGKRYKYQNPARPRQKWSGEGNKPEWFAELEKEGREAEALIAS